MQSDSGDFSLLDRKIIDIINKMPEEDRYVRGLRAWVGFRQTCIEYTRPERKASKSKYSFYKLVKLAFQGITSTSVKPLFLSGVLSFLVFLIIIGIIPYSLLAKFYTPENLMPKGWVSLMIAISFLSGCQLISIWLLSLYIARLFKETLSRPTYFVEYDSLVETSQMISNENES